MAQPLDGILPSAPDTVFLPTGIAVEDPRIAAQHIQGGPVGRSHPCALQAADLVVRPDPAVVGFTAHRCASAFIIYILNDMNLIGLDFAQ